MPVCNPLLGWDPGGPYRTQVLPLLSGFPSILCMFYQSRREGRKWGHGTSASAREKAKRRQEQPGPHRTSTRVPIITKGGAGPKLDVHSSVQSHCSSSLVSRRCHQVLLSYELREEKLSLISPSPGAGTESSAPAQEGRLSTTVTGSASSPSQEAFPPETLCLTILSLLIRAGVWMYHPEITKSTISHSPIRKTLYRRNSFEQAT